jgi:hypothetical protein
MVDAKGSKIWKKTRISWRATSRCSASASARSLRLPRPRAAESRASILVGAALEPRLVIGETIGPCVVNTQSLLEGELGLFVCVSLESSGRHFGQDAEDGGQSSAADVTPGSTEGRGHAFLGCGYVHQFHLRGRGRGRLAGILRGEDRRAVARSMPPTLTIIFSSASPKVGSGMPEGTSRVR